MSEHTEGTRAATAIGLFGNPPRELMRLARRTGGTIRHAGTQYDHEAGGRVLTMIVFWPEQVGYEAIAAGDEQ